MSVQGSHLIVPSSVQATGTGSTATINANGSVTFDALTLELRGVFSSIYDNYMVVCRATQSGTNEPMVSIRLLSGTSEDSTTNYRFQSYNVNATTITGTALSTQTSANVVKISPNYPQGFTIYVYGPYLARETSGRSIAANPSNNISIDESAWAHNAASSFDGIKIRSADAGSNNFSGLVAVYGLRK